MDIQAPTTSCLTCFQHPGVNTISTSSEANLALRDALRKHFWFTEEDLRRAIMCQTCSDQVINFNQFHVSVEELYQKQPVSVMIKSEPVQKENPPEDSIPMQPDVKFEFMFVSVEGPSSIKAEVDTEESSETAMDTTSQNDEETESEDTQPEVSSTASKCYICAEVLKTPSLLGIHIIRAHGEIPEYKCDICQKGFSAPAKLRDHRMTHNEFGCEFCGDILKSKAALFDHTTAYHYNEKLGYPCDICSRMLSSRKRLQEHMKVHKFQCDHCGEILQNQPTLNEHIDQNHSELSEDCVCELCSKVFPTQSLLRQHKRLSHREYKCDNCGQEFTNGRLLDHHIKWKHLDPKYLCNICGATSNQRCWMDRHKQTHESERKVHCKICNSWLKNMASWNAHIAEHQRTNEGFKFNIDAFR